MSDRRARQVVSLGGGCDVALMLLEPHGRSTTTHFFDYLWNLDGGLGVVRSIIEDDFRGFDSLDEFVFARHPEWNTEPAGFPVTLGCGNLRAEQLVHRRYPNVAFIHYKRNDELVQTLRRKAERFRQLLSDTEPVEFVYYRAYDHPINGCYHNGSDYDIREKLSYFETETTEFARFLERTRPALPFRLWAIFLAPPTHTPGVSDAIDEFVEKAVVHPAVSFAQAKHKGPGARRAWTAILRRIDAASRCIPEGREPRQSVERAKCRRPVVERISD